MTTKAERLKKEEAELQDLLINGPTEGPTRSRKLAKGEECTFCTAEATMLVDPGEIGAVAAEELPVCDGCWAEESEGELGEEYENIMELRRLMSEGLYFEEDEDDPEDM